MKSFELPEELCELSYCGGVPPNEFGELSESVEMSIAVSASPSTDFDDAMFSCCGG